MIKKKMKWAIVPLSIAFITLTSQVEPGGGFYPGFSMAMVLITTGGTITASIGGSAAGIIKPLQSAVNATAYYCCINTNSGSACNFNNENGICRTEIIRAAH